MKVMKTEQTYLVSDPDFYKSNTEQHFSLVCVTAFIKGSLERKEKNWTIRKFTCYYRKKYLIKNPCLLVFRVKIALFIENVCMIFFK